MNMAQQSVEELSAKLAEHRRNLQSVEQLLLTKAGDDTLIALRNDLLTVIDLTQNLLNVRTKHEQGGTPTAPRVSLFV